MTDCTYSEKGEDPDDNLEAQPGSAPAVVSSDTALFKTAPNEMVLSDARQMGLRARCCWALMNAQPSSLKWAAGRSRFR